MKNLVSPKTIIQCGDVFGFWTVIEFAGRDKQRNRKWLVRCVCGNEKVTGGQHLRSGASKSCGCKSAGLRGVRGEAHYLWKGGMRNVGSEAWANAKLDSLRQSRARRGGAPIDATPQEVLKLWEESGGKCAACGNIPPRALHLDHDYKTGLVRGFLCNQCNVALGMARDSAKVLRSIADYVELHNRRMNKAGIVRAS